MVFDFGYDDSKSYTNQYDNLDEFSRSYGSSYGRSNDRLYGPQKSHLGGLWDQAENVFSTKVASNQGRKARGKVMPGLQAGMSGLMGVVDPTAQIEAQAGSLQAGLGALFREEMMPGIQAGAIGAGGFGGGRQGVAEAGAIGQIADAFSQGYGDIVANANATAVNAASQMSPLAQAISSAQMMPLEARMQTLQGRSDIFGDPITLGRSRSGSKTKSRGRKTGRSGTESETVDKGFKFGIG